jgi:hypothetical protein
MRNMQHHAKNRIIAGALPVGLCAGVSTRHGDDTRYANLLPDGSGPRLHESLVHRQAAASC